MKIVTFIILLVSFPLTKDNHINAGPMVGYSQKSEVALWVQTKESSNVKFIYWEINNSDKVFETEEITTSKTSGFTATLIADRVKPGTVYHYQPIIDKDAQVITTELSSSPNDEESSSDPQS